MYKRQTYNALTKKFTKYELGCVKTNYATQSVRNETKLQEITLPNLLAIAKDNATSQITTALGGYVYKTQGELFIMDTDNPNTAQKVWRWNLNGLGYSKTGINGPYELAMTQDGNIVADFIRTGTMSVSRIEGLSNLLNGYSVQIGLNQENIDMLVSQQTNLENGITELAAQVKTNADNVVAEFKQIGGNNLFLNSIGDFESDNWEGNVRTFNSTDILRHSNSPSGNCFNLQKATAKQIVFVKNGTFTISFTYKKLIKFTLPTIIMMVFTSIYGVVDGIFVSNVVENNAFASINLIMPAIMIIGTIGFMIGTGGSAIISKTLGEGNKDEANKQFSMLIYLEIISGVIFTIDWNDGIYFTK